MGLGAGVIGCGFGVCCGGGHSKVQVHSPGQVLLCTCLIEHVFYEFLDILPYWSGFQVFLLVSLGVRFICGNVGWFSRGYGSCSSHPGWYGVGAQLEAHLVIHFGKG